MDIGYWILGNEKGKGKEKEFTHENERNIMIKYGIFEYV